MRKIFKLALAVLMLALGLSYFVEPRSMTSLFSEGETEGLGEAIARIERRFTLALIYDQGTEALPEVWQIPPASGQATPASPACLKNYLPVIETELGKYKPEVVEQYLGTLFVFRELKLFGVGYGGTVVANEIMLTLDCNTGYTHEYFARALHHEFSSILINQGDFPLEDWLAVSPEDFRYQESDDEILQSVVEHTGREGSRALYDVGFLTRYGQSTIENDINVYAEVLLTNPELLERLAGEHERVREKMLLLKAFYRNYVNSGWMSPE